jgi:hypothetical protein
MQASFPSNTTIFLLELLPLEKNKENKNERNKNKKTDKLILTYLVNVVPDVGELMQASFPSNTTSFLLDSSNPWYVLFSFFHFTVNKKEERKREGVECGGCGVWWVWA